MWGIAHTSRNTPLAPTAVGQVCKAVFCNFLRSGLTHFSQSNCLMCLRSIIACRNLALTRLHRIAIAGLSRKLGLG